MPSYLALHSIVLLCTELRCSSSRTSFESVRTKMVHLGSLYGRSEHFFPKEFLTLTLEKHSCELSWDKAGVYNLLREMGVPLVELFNVYDKLFKAKVGLLTFRFEIVAVSCGVSYTLCFYECTLKICATLT